MLDVEKIKQDFPILQRKINDNDFVYLDSASTSQKPKQVIEAVKSFYENNNSNIHRAVYKTAEESTEMYESAREKVRSFLNAKGYQIIFTKNCTEAINLVATGWASKNLKRDDLVTSTVMEHHSNIVPWQTLKHRGISLDFIDIDDNGNLQEKEPNSKLLTLTHSSNVLGTINDVKELTQKYHDNNSLVMVDAAQSAPHMKMDLKNMDCDFLTFSGHKMLAPTGVGVLAVKEEIAERMDPILFGSDMIKEVSLQGTKFADAPFKFETGTQNLSSVVGLSAAIDYINDVGMDNIEEHEKKLTEEALHQIGMIDGIKIFGQPKSRNGIISFNLEGTHSHDLATILNESGVAIRSGHHCTQPLMKRLGVTSVARASFYLYNTTENIEVLKEGIEKSKEVFKV